MLGNKYIIAAVGVGLALVTAYNVQFFMSRKQVTKPAAVSRTSVARPAEQAKAAEKVPPAPAQRKTEKGDSAAWKRDPFSLPQGAGAGVEMPEDLKVTAIVSRGNRGHVLINGKVYGVNDRVGTYVIKEIKQHSIVVLSGGLKQEISFDDYKVIKEKKK